MRKWRQRKWPGGDVLDGDAVEGTNMGVMRCTRPATLASDGFTDEGVDNLIGDEGGGMIVMPRVWQSQWGDGHINRLGGRIGRSDKSRGSHCGCLLALTGQPWVPSFLQYMLYI